jgi:Helix-turn-helix domain
MGHQPQQIPVELADQLEEGICGALGHPYRRQILRTLSAAGQKMSTIQLEASTGPSCPLSCTAYHARQLEEADLVAQVGSEAAEGTLTLFYSSLIGDDRLVHAVLQATEISDQQHLAPAAN